MGTTRHFYGHRRKLRETYDRKEARARGRARVDCSEGLCGVLAENAVEGFRVSGMMRSREMPRGRGMIGGAGGMRRRR
jgi:hypothetical protein